MALELEVSYQLQEEVYLGVYVYVDLHAFMCVYVYMYRDLIPKAQI